MTEYGKFKTADELLKGYVELEKSFTQKCQQLSALEKQISSGTSELSSPQNDGAQSTAETAAQVPIVEETQQPRPNTPVEPTPEQIKQYLDDNKDYVAKLLDEQSVSREAARTERPEDEATPLNGQSSRPAVVPLITGGGNVSMALPSKPKTLKEASQLAKNLFK